MTPTQDPGGSHVPADGRLPVALLGLGEAGAAIAADLAAAGAVVRGFDPLVAAVPGVISCRDDADACRGARVVVSLTCAHEAEGALAAALPAMPREAIYADFNTASPGQKAGLAALAQTAGRGFADVALMSPVPGRGLRTPMLVSGPAAVSSPRCSPTSARTCKNCRARPGPPLPGSWSAACSTKAWRRR